MGNPGKNVPTFGDFPVGRTAIIFILVKSASGAGRVQFSATLFKRSASICSLVGRDGLRRTLKVCFVHFSDDFLRFSYWDAGQVGRGAHCTNLRIALNCD